MPATVVAACDKPTARVRFSGPEIAGRRACQVVPVNACPAASAATSARTATGAVVNTSAAQAAACARLALTSSSRLSQRSAARPATGARITIGSIAATSSSAICGAPPPCDCHRSSSAMAAISSPSSDTARAETAMPRSRRFVKDILRS